jgi:multiple sugar transport system substrate-binding protein
MPFAFVVTPLYYNKTIFDRMGVQYPSLSWSWSDVRTAARKLAEDTNGDGVSDQWGFFSSYAYGSMDAVIHSFGGKILDDNYNVKVDEPQAVEAVKFLTDMVLTDGTAPKSGCMSTLFRQGKLAMGVDLNSNIDIYRQQSFDWDVAVLPKGPAKRVVRAWPDSFAIMSGSKNIEAAWKYVRFVTSQKKMDRYTGDRKIPVYRPLAFSREWLQEDQKPNKRVIIESVQYGDPLEFRPRWGEWTDLRNAALAPVWRGEQPPEFGLKKWADGIRAVLASPFQ